MRPILLLLLGSLVSLGCAAASSDATTAEQGDTAAAACPSADANTLSTLMALPARALACESVAPPDAELRPFRHPVTSTVVTAFASNHRARDLFFAPDETQWVLGKMAYGAIDKDLKDEDVDVWLLRGCDGEWEKLGTATTTRDGDHEPVEGIEDTGGRVYFQIPEARRLGVGRHRVRLVVAGDGTSADAYIEVLPKGAPIFVSDVDGTLTERLHGDLQIVCDEESDFPALWRSLFDGASQPALHAGAADAYTALAARGFRPLYLTARPEWLDPHTRAFLDGSARGDGQGDLPRGIVHTTTTLTGEIGSRAQAFKAAELARLRAKGFVPTLAFGNHTSDVAAYDAAGPTFKFFFDNLPTAYRTCSQVADLPLASSGALRRGDFRLESYTALVPLFRGACR